MTQSINGNYYCCQNDTNFDLHTNRYHNGIYYTLKKEVFQSFSILEYYDYMLELKYIYFELFLIYGIYYTNMLSFEY